MSSFSASYDSMMDPSQQIAETFIASLRSVGAACALAMVGVYLHRRGFIVGEGKKTLALICQQALIPLFLCVKIMDCEQNRSRTQVCPDVVASLRQTWILLIWPAYVVGMACIVSFCAYQIVRPPKGQIKPMFAAIMFGNSTVLPITMLGVVHMNFPKTSILGKVDPTLFLSIYLLLYPVLQWGIGGWLLAPESSDREQLTNGKSSPHSDNSSYGSTADDTDNYTLDMSELGVSTIAEESHLLIRGSGTALGGRDRSTSIGSSGSYGQYHGVDQQQQQQQQQHETSFSYATQGFGVNNNMKEISTMGGTEQSPPPLMDGPPPTAAHETTNLSSTIRDIFDRVFQPPCVGALTGLFITAFPQLRGLFVDLVDRTDNAPLEWVFDALSQVGKASIPITMIVLGCNLSASQVVEDQSRLLESRVVVAIIASKMVIMPCIGFATTLFLKQYVWDIEEDIAASFYLVVMIVFITPTANNVMIMVELSGSDAKEGVARLIAYQYMLAPFLLSFTMAVAVGIAQS